MVTAMLGSSFQGHEPEEQTRLAKRAIELLFHGIQVQNRHWYSLHQLDDHGQHLA